MVVSAKFLAGKGWAPGFPQCFKKDLRDSPQLLKVPVSTVRHGSILLSTLSTWEFATSIEILLIKEAVGPPVFSDMWNRVTLSGGAICFSKVWWIILRNPKVRGSWEFLPNLLSKPGVKGMAGVGGKNYFIQPQLIVSFLIFLFLFWCRAVCMLSDCLPLSSIARPHYFLFECFQRALNI